METETGVMPTFKIHSNPNPAKSKAAGRPIYDDMEVCEIRLAGNRNTVGVFPAHDVWKWRDTAMGDREPVTYAMRFNDQYLAFKSNHAQVSNGTPLEELTFLPQGKRMELKALNVHTAEALAGLDGQPLKNLGMGGRELKNQAQAYLDSAAGNADIVKLASENETLKAQIEEMKANTSPEVTDRASPYADEDDDTLKEVYKAATGAYPRGQCSHATLVRMCDEIAAKKAAENKEAA